jgi:hypothetical protein
MSYSSEQLMRLLVGEIFDFSDLREREPFPEAPVYEKTLFWTDPMTQTMEEAQERVRETTKTVIKATTVFVIIIIGVIYVLNGLGAYLEYVNTWPPGLGPIVVGIVLVILGWFASLMRQ